MYVDFMYISLLFSHIICTFDQSSLNFFYFSDKYLYFSDTITIDNTISLVKENVLYRNSVQISAVIKYTFCCYLFEYHTVSFFFAFVSSILTKLTSSEIS